MQLVTYLRPDGEPRAGALLREDQILDLAGAGAASGVSLPSSLFELLGYGPAGIDSAARAVATAQRVGLPTFPRSAARLLAPLPRPGKVLAVAGNYVDHIEESGQKALAKSQTTVRPFMKPANGVTGPDAPVYFPPWSKQLDYEAELAIVIGRRVTAVTPTEAAGAIAGYTIFNDISARSLTIGSNRVERPRDKFYDWLAGKWFDGFACFGPAITTADDIDDPQALRLTLDLNGDRRQDASTQQMIFDCRELVSFFSHLTTLEPGDIIATGTPSGVGAASGRFLEVGDVMEASIEGLGTLRNFVSSRTDTAN